MGAVKAKATVPFPMSLAFKFAMEHLKLWMTWGSAPGITALASLRYETASWSLVESTKINSSSETHVGSL